jgi:hypothetical protein
MGERRASARAAGLPPLVRDLTDPSAYPHRPRSVRLIQTHISWVFLAGEYAYKVKKPVELGFLDFRTLGQRRRFCAEEVRLNRRLAPDTYLGVVEIKRADGGYRLAGRGRTAEVAVWMRRLPAKRMLDRLVEAGEADGVLLERIGHVVADFHAVAAHGPAIHRYGSAAVIRGNWRENFAQTRHLPADILPPEWRRAIEAYVARFLADEARRLTARARAGRIRDCHGDLHAQHVCCTDPIRIFDCIEFNARFRYGDTASEIAFLAMDLEARGRPDLAIDFLNSYLDGSGDYDAVPLLDFYRAYRAYVRGKVYGIQAFEPNRSDTRALADQARRYFELAAASTEPRRRVELVVMTGLVASGKTTVARALARAGAGIVVRTDAVRKQLAGLPWSRRAPAAFGEGLYTAAMTRHTYATCLRIADALLGAGWPVIIDGTFGRREERDAARAVARRRRAPFRIVWCQAPDAELRARLRARAAAGGDISDAGEAVLQAQRPVYQAPEGEANVERPGSEARHEAGRAAGIKLAG